MADFLKAYEPVRQYEGGWCDVPGDAGGETYAGIARNFFPDWPGWKVIDEARQHVSFRSGARAFSKHLDSIPGLADMVTDWYRAEWWEPMHLAQFPQSVADEIFEQSVNLGCAGAGKYLQRLCNALNYDKRTDARLFPDLMEDGAVGPRTLAALAALPEQAKHVLELAGEAQRFASRHFDRKHVFYIGRGLDWALSMEASLKLKEVSYIFSEAYAAGELKHGTIALIEQGSLVCALLTQHALAEKTLSNIREVKSRGADVLGLTVESKGGVFQKTVDHVITVPDTHPMLLPSLDVIPMQLFAYYVALMRGCDIDKPRNLAKSVTVE